MQTFIERKEDLNWDIEKAADALIKSDMINWLDLPMEKRRKILARTLISNCVIDELRHQVYYLITGESIDG